MSTIHNSTPVIISGFSSQNLAKTIAEALGTTNIEVKRKQFNDKEIDVTIEHNIRGRDVVVVASGSGDPNKQEKEARLLMRAANRAGAHKVTLLLPYMWYGRSDDDWDERHSPALVDTIETLRAHCQNAIIVDPHNAILTREKFLDTGSPTQNCQIAHLAFPYAIQLKALIDQGVIHKKDLLFTHADAGATKRISRSFRACMYNLLGFTDRDPDENDWAQGLKDRNKATNKSEIVGVSADVTGKDIVIFEDMIASAHTACDLAALLKERGARSVTLFATTGIFTSNPSKGELPTAAITRINASHLDAVFITDTYDYRLINSTLSQAIEKSPIIHEIKTGAYLASIIRALHLEVDDMTAEDENSILAISKGTHPDETRKDQTISRPVPLKAKNPLLSLHA